MFGSIGGPEFLLIAVLALLLFGPRKLPQIGRSIGRALAEFRGATHEFKTSLQREVDLEQLREARDGLDAAGREITEAVRDTSRPDGGPDSEPERAASSSDGESPTQS
jgi:Tat protein translocase TatB subunit